MTFESWNTLLWSWGWVIHEGSRLEKLQNWAILLVKRKKLGQRVYIGVWVHYKKESNNVDGMPLYWQSMAQESTRYRDHHMILTLLLMIKYFSKYQIHIFIDFKPYRKWRRTTKNLKDPTIPIATLPNLRNQIASLDPISSPILNPIIRFINGCFGPQFHELRS